MTESYLVEETAGEHRRAFAATVANQSVLIALAFDDAVSFEISLEELKFIARAAGTLPPWLLDADNVAGPARDPDRHRRIRTPAAPVVAEEPAEPAAEPKPERHGRRWDVAEDEQLLDAFLNDKLDVRALAARLERSPSSIVSRLLHLDAVEVRPKR